jgi:serine/threonine protein kinase
MSRDQNVVEKVVASLRNIGRFELSPLREGERGACFKAFDSVRRISVAIRTVWPENDDHLQRMLAQARLAQTVEHSNLSKVIGSGELEGAFFAVTSFSNGNTLRQNLIDGVHLNTWDLIDFARQVSVGLESAHARGVVHNALHPNNVVQEFDGTTKILDIGLYRANDPEHDAFFRNAVYLSPEQLAGHATDRQTNFYSLAIMLYEIATAGRLPYEGDSWEELARASQREITEPIQWNSSVPPGINAAIVKALSRDRLARFENGPDLVRALEDYKSFDRPVAPALPQSPKPAPQKVVSINAAAAAMPVRNPYATVPEIASPPADPELEFASTASRVSVDKPKLVGTQESGVWNRTDIIPAQPATEPPTEEASPQKKIPRGATERLAYHFRQRLRKLDPWILALTALILILSGFILRTIALSYWGYPADDYKYSRPVPQPPPPHDAAPALPPAITEEEPAVPTTTSASTAHHASRKNKGAAPAPTPTPFTSLANTGSVMITTIPAGARVVVDGRPDQAFSTPQLIPSLSEGVHTLTITKDGYAPATRPVQITAGAKSNLTVQLDLPSGFLTVLSNPSTAFILIDGVNTGHVTPSQVPVSAGSHTLTLRKMGYLETSDAFTVKSGEQQSRNVTLLESGSTPDIRVVPSGNGHKLFGNKINGVKITVHTTPAGATVLINGQTVQKSTPVDFALNPGSYVMEIQLSGYQTLRKTITVEPGKPLALDESLHQ